MKQLNHDLRNYLEHLALKQSAERFLSQLFNIILKAL